MVYQAASAWQLQFVVGDVPAVAMRALRGVRELRAAGSALRGVRELRAAGSAGGAASAGAAQLRAAGSAGAARGWGGSGMFSTTILCADLNTLDYV